MLVKIQEYEMWVLRSGKVVVIGGGVLAQVGV